MTNKHPASIEYHGIAGGSLDCESAIVRLVLAGDVPKSARILSHGNDHGLLLRAENGDQIAVKAGFSSGYGGTGPNCFSLVLQMLRTHGCEIDECDVEQDVLERLNASTLTYADLNAITASEPIRPSRWPDYVLEKHYRGMRTGSFWRDVAPVMPYPLIEERIFDLALSFEKAPAVSILSGYIRLEDLVRERISSEDHGQRLLTSAFVGDKSALHWNIADQAEHNGRAGLFVNAFLAHRNRKAHREVKQSRPELLQEFLVLNHLFMLESQALPRAGILEAKQPDPE